MVAKAISFDNTEMSDRGLLLGLRVKSVIFLYNDRDRPAVDVIVSILEKPWTKAGTAIWVAHKHLNAFGSLFEQIEGQIESAAGTVLFLGSHGLGRFQQNIEMGAVNTEIWQQGATYGRLLVHLAPGLLVPRNLLSWPTVNHDGSAQDEAALAAGISGRFGIPGPDSGQQ